jgi:hypothetical protein
MPKTHDQNCCFQTTLQYVTRTNHHKCCNLWEKAYIMLTETWMRLLFPLLYVSLISHRVFYLTHMSWFHMTDRSKVQTSKIQTSPTSQSWKAKKRNNLIVFQISTRKQVLFFFLFWWIFTLWVATKNSGRPLIQRAFFEKKEGPKLPYLEGKMSEFTKFRLGIGSKTGCQTKAVNLNKF